MPRPPRVAGLFAIAIVLLARPVDAGAQDPRANWTGEQLFVAACAGCHGTDGKGREQHEVGFADALPDFTDCSYASREAAADWQALVHEGGPVRSFSRRMPAFGKALSQEQIARVVAYVRSFCSDKKWPRGELNLPRPLATEKAFPEDEAVLTMNAVTRQGVRALTTTLVYERRIGARTQWELAVPFSRVEQGTPGVFAAGIGDVVLALKRTLAHDGERGYILSVGSEVQFPTGRASKGLGAQAVVFEPFLLAAKTVGESGYLQFHGGFEVPTNEKFSEKEAFARVAIGTTITQGYGRAFSPMIEIVGAHELEGGAQGEVDWIPQMQVSLSRRQHILASFGMRLPVTQRSDRPKEFLAYLIWDWFDGGLFAGWK